MVQYLIVLAIAAVTTFLLTPLARRLALKVGAVDQPSDRKVHPRPTPTLGGTAILLGIVVALATAHSMPFFSSVYENSSEVTAALVSGGVIFLVGVYDDMKGVIPAASPSSPSIRFTAFTIASTQMIVSGTDRSDESEMIP